MQQQAMLREIPDDILNTGMSAPPGSAPFEQYLGAMEMSRRAQTRRAAAGAQARFAEQRDPNTVVQDLQYNASQFGPPQPMPNFQQGAPQATSQAVPQAAPQGYAYGGYAQGYAQGGEVPIDISEEEEENQRKKQLGIALGKKGIKNKGDGTFDQDDYMVGMLGMPEVYMAKYVMNAMANGGEVQDPEEAERIARHKRSVEMAKRANGGRELNAAQKQALGRVSGAGYAHGGQVMGYQLGGQHGSGPPSPSPEDLEFMILNSRNPQEVVAARAMLSKIRQSEVGGQGQGLGADMSGGLSMGPPPDGQQLSDGPGYYADRAENRYTGLHMGPGGPIDFIKRGITDTASDAGDYISDKLSNAGVYLATGVSPPSAPVEEAAPPVEESATEEKKTAVSTAAAKAPLPGEKKLSLVQQQIADLDASMAKRAEQASKDDRKQEKMDMSVALMKAANAMANAKGGGFSEFLAAATEGGVAATETLAAGKRDRSANRSDLGQQQDRQALAKMSILANQEEGALDRASRKEISDDMLGARELIARINSGDGSDADRDLIEHTMKTISGNQDRLDLWREEPAYEKLMAQPGMTEEKALTIYSANQVLMSRNAVAISNDPRLIPSRTE